MKKNYILAYLLTICVTLGGFAQTTAPFTESFNSGIPASWTQSATTGGPWVTVGNMGYDGSTIVDHTGTPGSSRMWLDFSGTDVGVIVQLDTIDVTNVPQPELSFFYNNNLGTNDNNPFNSTFVEAYDGSAWVVLEQIQQDNMGVWSEHYYNLCGYVLPGDILLVRFRGERGSSISGSAFFQDLAIDDISVDTIRSACSNPIGLAVANVTDTSAIMSWGVACSDTAWSVKWGSLGFDPLVAGTYIHTNVDTLVVDTLMDLQSYEFYVRSYCSTGDTSGWAGPHLFITLPSCVAPINQSVEFITASGATLKWDSGAGPKMDTAWSIKYDTTGFDPVASGNYVHTNADSLIVTGLNSLTTYDFYVRGYCNSGDTSVWIGPFSFTTLCSSFVPTYTEDFTTITFASPPSCWDQGSGRIGLNSTIAIGSSNWNGNAFAHAGGSNSARLNLYATRYDWLMSPTIDLGNGSLPYQVEFDLAFTDYFTAAPAANGLGTDDTIALVISTDNGATWSDTNILLLWDANTPAPSHTGQFVALDLTALGYSGEVRLAFYTHSIVSNEDNDVFVDNFAVRFVPTCPRPLNFRALSVFSDSVNLTWDSVATDSAWILEYGPVGFVPGTGTSVNTVSDTSFINGLLDNTTYSVYVTSICDITDTSLVTGPLNFTTPCSSVSPPYTEDFATMTGLPPSCWEQGSGALNVNSTIVFGASFWTGSEYRNVAGNSIAASVNIYGSRLDWLFSPVIDLGNGSIPYQVEFDIAFTDWNNSGAPANGLGVDDRIALVISTDNGLTWSDTNILLLWDVNTGPPALAGEYAYVDLTAAGYTGEVQFAFYSETTISNEDNDLFIDNFAVVQVPTCPRPIGLTFDTASLTTADISWTNGANDVSWIIEHGPTGFARGTGTTASIAANPTQISGLTASTCYDVYLRSICAVGDTSLWIGPLNFCTECGPVVETCEDFESVSSGLPLCWEKFVATTGTSNVQIGTFGGNNAPNNLQMTSGNDATSTLMLISPEMTALGAGTHRAVFWVDGSFTTDTMLIVGTMSDPADPGTFAAFDTILDITSSYQFYSIPFTSYTGSDTRIAFLYNPTANFRTISIDDFCFEEIPSCEKAPAVDLLSAGLDSTSMDIGWNLDTTQVSYFIAYGPAGYDPENNPANGDTVTAQFNFVTVTGLQPLTEYCFWVKAVCTNGDTSFWDGPHCGPTGCPASAAIPYTQDFSTYTFAYPDGLPLCWEEARAIYTSGVAPTRANSQWTPDGFANVGGTGSARIELWSTGRNEWLISPSLDLGSTTGRHIRIEYDIAATLWNNTSPAVWGVDDSVMFMISRNDGVSWDDAGILAVYDSSGNPSATGDRVVIDLPNETGVVKFAFYGTSKVSNQDNNIYIDNFKVYDSVFVGLNENIREVSNYSVFPNPNTGLFTVLNEGGANQTSLKVMDIQGRIVYDETYFFNTNARKEIDVNALKAGVYILLIQSEGKLEQHRVVIQ